MAWIVKRLRNTNNFAVKMHMHEVLFHNSILSGFHYRCFTIGQHNKMMAEF